MKLWIMSDLHLDACRPHERFYLPKDRPEHDLVVIAGDICEGMVKGVQWIAAQGFEKPVVYVGGNHEFYGRARDTEIVKAREEAAKHSSIHVLQDQKIGYIANGTKTVTIFGSTLWTDYRLDGEAYQALAMRAAIDSMNDHRRIRYAAAGYRRWMPVDALAEHEQSRTAIKQFLDVPYDGLKIVVTHHAPSPRSIDSRYARSALNAAYASNLETLVDRCDLWIHGHVHKAQDYTLGRCRVVANPHGYPGEWSNFEACRVVEINSTEVASEHTAAA